MDFFISLFRTTGPARSNLRPISSSNYSGFTGTRVSRKLLKSGFESTLLRHSHAQPTRPRIPYGSQSRDFGTVGELVVDRQRVKDFRVLYLKRFPSPPKTRAYLISTTSVLPLSRARSLALSQKGNKLKGKLSRVLYLRLSRWSEGFDRVGRWCGSTPRPSA